MSKKRKKDFYDEEDDKTGLGLSSETRNGIYGVVTLGVWQHVAVVADGATGTFYVNGKNAGSGALTQLPIDTTISFVIGEVGSFAGRNFNGLIDEVRVYNRALSASEVLNLYQSR